MKTLQIVLFTCTFVGVLAGNQFDRIYDNDNQHKRSAARRVKEPRQKLGYEEVETTSEYWQEKAQSIIQAKLAETRISTKAKNVVYFLGDGMSPQTVAATRMYLGNENKMLSFEEFPYLASAKTYCVDEQVADSACTATAYLSGVKTNYGTINVAPSVLRSDCTYNRTESEFLGLLQWAQDSGMATGIVTTTRITHATPAGTYANTADRDWEDDSYVVKSGCDPLKYPDIAHQLVQGEVGKKFKVVLGGGRRHFIPSPEMDEENSPGFRIDGRNLIDEWKQVHPNNAEYVWNKAGLQSVDVSKTQYLLGLFESDHCLFNLEIEEQKAQTLDPKLTEMVEVALEMLVNSENGFFLFVEGGKIDSGHHGTQPRLALEETAEFARAVELALKRTSAADTLIVVTADHGHTMTYNGYTERGNDILGIADISDKDDLPYTTLSYANGLGFYDTYKDENPSVREDITGYDFSSYHTKYQATVPLDTETHGGEDVAVYASGPMAHMFRGNFEQNVIPDLIAYAAKIGQYKEESPEPDSGSSLIVCLQLAIACGVAALIMQLNW